jgi:hypothetical protein
MNGSFTMGGTPINLGDVSGTTDLTASDASSLVNKIQDKMNVLKGGVISSADAEKLDALSQVKNELTQQIDTATQGEISSDMYDYNELVDKYGSKKADAMMAAADQGFSAIKSGSSDFYAAGELGQAGQKALTGKAPSWFQSMIGRRLPYMALMMGVGGYKGGQDILSGKTDPSTLLKDAGLIGAGAIGGYAAAPVLGQVAGGALGQASVGGSALSRILGQTAASGIMNAGQIGQSGAAGTPTAMTGTTGATDTTGNPVNVSPDFTTISNLQPIDTSAISTQKQQSNNFVQALMLQDISKTGGENFAKIKELGTALSANYPNPTASDIKEQQTYNEGLQSLQNIYSAWTQTQGAQGSAGGTISNLLSGITGGPNATYNQTVKQEVTNLNSILKGSKSTAATVLADTIKTLIPSATDSPQLAQQKWRNIFEKFQTIQDQLSEQSAASSNDNSTSGDVASQLQTLLGM